MARLQIQSHINYNNSKETPRIPKPKKNRAKAEERQRQLDERERRLIECNQEVTAAIKRVNEFLQSAKVYRLEDAQRAVQHRENLARLMSSKPRLRETGGA